MGLLIEIDFQSDVDNTVTVQLAYFGTNIFLNGMKNKMQNSIRLWQKYFDIKIKFKYNQQTIRSTDKEFKSWFRSSHNNEALMTAMLKTFKERKTWKDQLQTIETKLMNLENEQGSLYTGHVRYGLKNSPFEDDNLESFSSKKIKISPSIDKFFKK